MEIRRLLVPPMLMFGLFTACLAMAAPNAEQEGGCSTGCHKNKVREAFVHTPVKAGECYNCHQPTAEKHPRVKKAAFKLLGEKEKLCYSCHENKDDKKFVHGPVASGDCTACHDVHQSPYKAQLRADGAELCFMCHEKEKFSGKYEHAPVAMGNCIGCHDPHQSNFRYMLRNSGALLCFTCHDKKLAEGKTVHGPVTEGDCLACHVPHASPYRKILKNTFPEEFYLPYQAENFALCFGCHRPEIAQDQRTDSLTNFRNGDLNLHYLHINKPDKGRSCKTCHEPHAGNQERLIKEMVPGFGKWDIPIRFTRKDAGGTCVVGCHKPKTYNRESPFTNP